MGRPRLRCPRVGSHSTGLLAGSWCLWQCPAGLIPLAAIFWLTLGIPSYRVWVGHMRTLADVKHYMQHSRVAPVPKFLRSLIQVSSIHCHGGEQILQLRRRSWAWFVGGVWNAIDWPRHSGPSQASAFLTLRSCSVELTNESESLTSFSTASLNVVTGGSSGKGPKSANLLVFAFNFLPHGKMQILDVQTLISQTGMGISASSRVTAASPQTCDETTWKLFSPGPIQPVLRSSPRCALRTCDEWGESHQHWFLMETH